MGLTYRDAGVDIDAGEELVSRIGPLAASTRRPGVMGGLGGFGGLFDVAATGYKDPILVSGTDGVGTKLKLAFAMDRHDTVGIDLVAMCVNDVLTVGAAPLFFLDYFATGRLHPEHGEAVVKGIVEGCKQSNCALLGGETAEMPGMYPDGEYDLAGFVVGAVEREEAMNPANVESGDVLLGLSSSGLHSNGYSLARKALVDPPERDLQDVLEGETRSLGDLLLEPTRIYVKPVLHALAGAPGAIRAMAHITGGGLVENLPRVLPSHLTSDLTWGSWPEPSLFGHLRAAGIAESEMRRTFNLGIGMVLVVKPSEVDQVTSLLSESGESVHRMGEVVPQ
ncbi:MAG: phosphoribosylformylglycinamidine cyclo-ligase [Myxococcota bacterium]|nr:phosphoribosylformylglycinamidine cyclo-ligase [Myxococcota bacterium]